MTQLTDEEKQAQGMAMLDKDKAEFELMMQRLRADLDRLAGQARRFNAGIKMALASALLLLLLPFFIDLSFYWFSVAAAVSVILIILGHWQVRRIRRHKKEIKAQGQKKIDELKRKTEALKASWE